MTKQRRLWPAVSGAARFLTEIAVTTRLSNHDDYLKGTVTELVAEKCAIRVNRSAN